MAGRASENTRIQLCGRLSVEIQGVEVADQFRGRQVRLLLAYLVLNRARPVDRDELIGALWPSHPPQSEDAALRTLLSRLRSAIGSSAVSGRDEVALVLPEPVWIDVEAAGTEIERALAALEQGDPRSAWALAQVPLNIASRRLLPGAQASWLEPRRRELDEVRLQALEVIGRAGLAIGGTQLASVERAARALIESEPYRESGYVLLMESLAAQGNIAEGVRTFDRLRTLLRDELGTTPSPEALAVGERLLSPGTRRARPRREAAPEPTIALPAELLARAEVPLVGRHEELAQLGQLWAAASAKRDPEPSGEALDARAEAAARRRRIVLLAGEAGIGKTRLVAELARKAHDEGSVVLTGRASEETLAPYQPFLEALRHFFLNAPLRLLRSTSREYGAELARLVPELRRRAPDLPAAVTGEPETERYRLFEAVVGLLAAIAANSPILLALDDLQWADRPTLLLLRHLARAPDPDRLLILVAYRQTESEPSGFAGTLADFRRDGLVTELGLGGLNETETAELVRLRTGETPSAELAGALHAETEGNPLFIEEIVRHLTEAGVSIASAGAAELQRVGLPEGVKQVIARRLAALNPRTVEWLRVAAVIGRDFDASLLERVVGFGEDEFLDALDEALAGGLVVEASAERRGYSFSHALIRETLYEGMSAARRASTHRRVGEALEKSRRESLPALALHFTRAAGPQDAEKAIAYASRAGDQATAMLAHEEAAEHYARALEVVERFEPDAVARRCDLLLLVGEARVRSGERSLARTALQGAGALAEQLGDRERLARAAIALSREYVQEPGVVDHELISMLERALELTRGERTITRARLLARLCGAIYFAGSPERMQACSDEAWEIAEELNDPEAQAYASAARRRARWDPDHLSQRLEESTRMLTLASQVGSLELELQAHAWLVVDLLERGDRDAVDVQIDAFSAGAQRLRQPLYVWNAIVWRSMRALLAGRLELAERLAADAVEAGASAESVTAPQYYAIQLLAVRREQDRLAELEHAARQFVDAHPDRAAWRATFAMLLSETGNTAAAAELADGLAAQDYHDIPRDGDWLIAMAMLSDLAVGLGDSDRAALLYEELLPYAASNVVVGMAVTCLGSVSRFLGKLAALLGRVDDAASHFERALEANRALKAPVLVAHTQLDYAAALGPGERAAELIDDASRLAAASELPAISRRVAQLRDARVA
jgi:DNA-binding SARP family transcriptional activator/tetratricopeptide (TPR) repeat protein